VKLALKKSSKMSQLDLGSRQFSGYKWTYDKNGGFAGGEIKNKERQMMRDLELIFILTLNLNLVF